MFGLSIVSADIVCRMRRGMRQKAGEEWVFTSMSSVSESRLDMLLDID